MLTRLQEINKLIDQCYKHIAIGELAGNQVYVEWLNKRIKQLSDEKKLLKQNK